MMRLRISTMALMLLVLMTASGCDMFVRSKRLSGVSEKTITIAVEGTPGLAFEGSYGTANDNQRVTGRVPAQYTVKSGAAIVVAFTKTGEEGDLVVRVLVDGTEVQRRQTDKPYGSVILTYRTL